MQTHETTIGEGSAYVTCGYQFDSDGDLDTLNVMLGGVDIFQALTYQQIAEIEDKCRAAAKADYEERKLDTKIDNLIELMNAETERLTR